jgi:hypothetical protein
MLRIMGNLLKLIWGILTRLFRSRVALEAENVTLRHQLNVLHRKAPKRVVFNNFDKNPACHAGGRGFKSRLSRH